MARITLFLALVALYAAPAAAQAGRIAGQISDETGAVLPGVQIRAVLRDGADETTRSVMTDASGRFVMGSLAPGAWALTASLPGFEATAYGTTVQGGESIDWNPTLRLGSIMETITITTAPPDGPLRRESPVPQDFGGTPRTTPTAPGPGVVRVGGSVKPPRKIVDVRPVYPADVAAQGVSGVVILSAIIGADGLVRDVKTLRSPNDALTFAASSAFNGWQFTPTLLNGSPVDTRIMATFNFTQQQ